MNRKTEIRLFGKVIDLDSRTLSYGNEKRKVEPQLIRLLQVLFDKRGALVTKEELLQKVWPDTVVTDDSLTKAISKLRKQLDSGLDKSVILTVNGSGYLLRKSSLFEGVKKTRFTFIVLIMMIAVLFYTLFISGIVQWVIGQ